MSSYAPLSRRKFLRISGLGALGVTAVACSSGEGTGDARAGASEPRQGGTLTVSQTTPVLTSIDPHEAFIPPTFWLVGQMYSRLVKFDTGADVAGLGEIIPDLASDWKVSGDGLTYSFHLRKDVTWHDIPPVNGRGLTSDDVVATMNRIFERPSASKWLVDPVRDFEAPDDHTVVFHLEEPYAPLLTNLAQLPMVIVPREGVEGGFDLAKQAIGTGPFILDSWERGVEMVRTANPKYFVKGLPYVDEFRTVLLDDREAALAAVRSGRVAQADTGSYFKAKKAAKDSNLRRTSVSSVPIIMYLQQAVRPFGDARVRKGIARAIDFESMGKQIRGEYERSSTVPPRAGEHALGAEEIRKIRPYDPDQARQLLADAGYPGGFKTTLTTTDNHPEYVREAEWIAQDLAKVGVDLTVEVVDSGTLSSRREEGNFEMLRGSRGLLTAEEAFHDYYSKGPGNVGNIDDPNLDRMIEEQRRTLDPDQRKKIILQIQRYMEKEIGNPIVDPGTVLQYVYDSRLQDFHPHVAGADPHVYEQVWLAE